MRGEMVRQGALVWEGHIIQSIDEQTSDARGSKRLKKQTNKKQKQTNKKTKAKQGTALTRSVVQDAAAAACGISVKRAQQRGTIEGTVRGQALQHKLAHDCARAVPRN
jgi:hypothetical protein